MSKKNIELVLITAVLVLAGIYIGLVAVTDQWLGGWSSALLVISAVIGSAAGGLMIWNRWGADFQDWIAGHRARTQAQDIIRNAIQGQDEMIRTAESRARVVTRTAEERRDEIIEDARRESEEHFFEPARRLHDEAERLFAEAQTAWQEADRRLGLTPDPNPPPAPTVAGPPSAAEIKTLIADGVATALAKERGQANAVQREEAQQRAAATAKEREKEEKTRFQYAWAMVGFLLDLTSYWWAALVFGGVLFLAGIIWSSAWMGIFGTLFLLGGGVMKLFHKAFDGAHEAIGAKLGGHGH